ncbi:cytochrome c [Lucifera butyrica]|uniref:Cytochrome c n=1 Tax=Lucifera butyrica TaxID=1351585 RepID=A0A498RHZ3_9FIRM|nr:cytochrome c [Lucifera butyrica]VBB09733.1 cytochrome c [Lucifera butyrica]
MGLYLKGFLVIITASLVAFALLIYISIAHGRLPPVPAEAEQGKMVFQQKGCIECHTIFGNGGYSGGDLTKVYGKFGPAALRDYLVHPPLITGTKYRRHDKLTEEEADEVTAYFKFLNSVNTLGWPPRPVFSKEIK